MNVVHDPDVDQDEPEVLERDVAQEHARDRESHDRSKGWSPELPGHDEGLADGEQESCQDERESCDSGFDQYPEQVVVRAVPCPAQGAGLGGAWQVRLVHHTESSPTGTDQAVLRAAGEADAPDTGAARAALVREPIVDETRHGQCQDHDDPEGGEPHGCCPGPINPRHGQD